MSKIKSRIVDWKTIVINETPVLRVDDRGNITIDGTYSPISRIKTIELTAGLIWMFIEAGIISNAAANEIMDDLGDLLEMETKYPGITLDEGLGVPSEPK